MTNGAVTCRVRLDRGGYVPGEAISIWATITNKSRVTIKHTRASLTEVIFDVFSAKIQTDFWTFLPDFYGLEEILPLRWKLWSMGNSIFSQFWEIFRLFQALMESWRFCWQKWKKRGTESVSVFATFTRVQLTQPFSKQKSKQILIFINFIH